MKTSSKVMLGVLGTVAAGVAVAMWLNPEKTKAVCSKLMTDISDLSSKLKQKVVERAEMMDSQVQDFTA